MDDKKMEILGENKVKVEEAHEKKLREFWNSALTDEVKEGKPLESLGCILKPDLIDTASVIENGEDLSAHEDNLSAIDMELPDNENSISLDSSEIVMPNFDLPKEDTEDYKDSIETSEEDIDTSEIETKEPVVQEIAMSEIKEPVVQEIETPEIKIEESVEPKDDDIDLSDNIEKQAIEEEDNNDVNEEKDYKSEYDFSEDNDYKNEEFEETDENSYEQMFDADINESYDKVTQNMTALQVSFDDFKAQIDEMSFTKDAEIKKLSKQLNELTQDLRSESSKRQVLEDENIELGRDNRNLSTRLESERGKRISAENNVTELEGVLRDKEGIISSLKANISRIESKHKALDKENDELKTMIVRQKDENRQVRIDLSTQREQNVSLERELAKREREIDRLKSQIKGFKTNVTVALSDLKKEQPNKDDKKKITEQEKKSKSKDETEKNIDFKPEGEVHSKYIPNEIYSSDVIDAFENVSKKGRSR